MSLDEWITVAACVSALWGIVVTFWSPQRLKTKLLCLLVFAVLAVTAVLLVRAQTKEKKKSEQESQLAQSHLQDSLNVEQQKLSEVKEQLNEIQRLARQPGMPNDRLTNALEAINRLVTKTDLPLPSVSVTTKVISGGEGFPFGLRLTIHPNRSIRFGAFRLECSGPIGSAKWQPRSRNIGFSWYKVPNRNNYAFSQDWMSPDDASDVDVFSNTRISCELKLDQELLPNAYLP